MRLKIRLVKSNFNCENSDNMDKPGPKGVIQESSETISLNRIEELWRVFCKTDQKAKGLKVFAGSCNEKLVNTSLYTKFVVLFGMFAEMKEGTMLFFLGHVEDLGVAFTKKGNELKCADTAKKPNLPIPELKKKMGTDCYYWIRPQVMF